MVGSGSVMVIEPPVMVMTPALARFGVLQPGIGQSTGICRQVLTTQAPKVVGVQLDPLPGAGSPMKLADTEEMDAGPPLY